jgi:hypothetical protein
MVTHDLVCLPACRPDAHCKLVGINVRLHELVELEQVCVLIQISVCAETLARLELITKVARESDVRVFTEVLLKLIQGPLICRLCKSLGIHAVARGLARP